MSPLAGNPWVQGMMEISINCSEVNFVWKPGQVNYREGVAKKKIYRYH